MNRRSFLRGGLSLVGATAIGCKARDATPGDGGLGSDGAIGSDGGTGSDGGSSAPAFTAAPVLIGTPTVGMPCAYTQGTYTGAAVTVTRQWLLDDVAVSGATGVTYTPTPADAGHVLKIQETATNAAGSASSTSEGAAVVASSGGAVTAVLSLSRSTGTGPLFVLFDGMASSTTKAGYADAWRQLRFDFKVLQGGAVVSAAYVNGAAKYQQLDSGPLFSCVLLPGSYVALMSVTDGTDTAFAVTQTIVVDDPNVVYAGNKTTLISPSSAWDDATYPGCLHATSVPAPGAQRSNHRYLLHRGESYGSITTPYSGAGSVGVHWGAYGTGTDPIVPEFSVGTGNVPTSTQFPNDLVVQGLAFTNAYRQWASASRITVHECSVSSAMNQDTAFTPASSLTYWGTGSGGGFVSIGAADYFWPNQCVFSECTGDGNQPIGDPATTRIVGIFSEGWERSAMLGCALQRWGQHNVRFGLEYKCHSRGNDFGGSISAHGGHAYKLHGRGTTPFQSNLAAGAALATRYVLSCEDSFGAAYDTNTWTMGFAPENTNADEGLEDCIVERPTFTRGVNPQQDITLGGRRMTRRGATIVGGGAVHVLTSAHMTIPSNDHGAGFTAAWDGSYYDN